MELTILIISIALIFIGTTLGAFFVYFYKNNISDRYRKIILGLTLGLILSSAIFSLLIPSISLGKSLFSNYTFIPIILGFILGGFFLFIINQVSLSSKNSSWNLFFAITLHNIPEGIAVGLACIGAVVLNDYTLAIDALIFSIAIAIQNIPEGMGVSVNYLTNGSSKNRSFTLGFLSGVVEPIFAIIAVFLYSSLKYLEPFLMAFSTGTIIYVVVDELLEIKSVENKLGIIVSFFIGFLIMLFLEIIF